MKKPENWIKVVLLSHFVPAYTRVYMCECVCVCVCVCACERARLCLYIWSMQDKLVTYYLCIFLSIRKVGTNIASNFLVSTHFKSYNATFLLLCLILL